MNKSFSMPSLLKRAKHVFGILLMVLLFISHHTANAQSKLAKVTYRASTLNPATTQNLYVRDSSPTTCTVTPAPVEQLRKATLNVLLNWNADYIQAPATVNQYTVSFTIKAYSSYSGTTGLIATYTPTLTITVDKPQAYVSIDFTGQYYNINRFEIVPAYTPPVASSPVNSLIMADVYYNEEFEYNVSSPGFSMLTAANASFDDNFATFSWSTNCIPAPNYQFQLLRLFNTDSTKRTDDRDIIAKIDWNNALTIETGNSLNELSLTIAEGAGYYVWRVRPIGNAYEGGIANDRNWGTWTSTGSLTQGATPPVNNASPPYLFYFSYGQYDPYVPANTLPGYDPYKRHDGLRNWIFTRGFVEGDAISKGQTNIGESISYANNLQMATQNQARITSENKTLVTETIYDYSGRAALKTIPAPVDRKTLGFIPSYIKNETGNAYTAYDFDYSFSYTTTPSSNEFKDPKPMDQNLNTSTGLNGPGNYYSSQNKVEDNVPTADGYPFTRTIFSKDGKNTPIETGMPGSVHKLTSVAADRHTTRAMESSVADMELIRIFGDEAPDETSVYKSISIDANNSASVAYISKEGKTIATCLASPGAPNLTPLASASSPSFSVTTNVNANNSSYGSNGFRSFKTLALTEQTNVTLNYGLNANNYTDGACINLCSTCDYKISLNIIENNGEQATQTFTFVIQPPSHLSGNCLPGSVTTNTTVTLQPGSYTIERIIETNTAPNSSSNTYINSYVTQVQNLLQTRWTTGTANVVDDAGQVIFGKPDVDMSVLFTLLNGSNLNDFYTHIGGIDPGQTHVNLQVDHCGMIRVPVWTCPVHTCQGEDLDFEKYLYDWYGLTTTIEKEAKLVEMFPGLGYTNVGDFNVVIQNMLSTHGNYDCQQLWNCWEGTVAMFAAQTASPQPTSYTPPGTSTTITTSTNYLHSFLTCTGYHIEGITSTASTGVSTTSFGYQSHPYAYFDYPVQCCACEAAFIETVTNPSINIPPAPTPTTTVVPCVVGTNSPSSFAAYFNETATTVTITPNSGQVAATTTITTTNKNAFFECYFNNMNSSISGVDPCDPAETTFYDDLMAGSVGQMVEMCLHHCDEQYNSFVTGIRDLYHDNNIHVQGDPYNLIPDVAYGGYTFGNIAYAGDPSSDIPLSTIYCQANGTLGECKSRCYLDVTLDSAAQDLQIQGIMEVIGGTFEFQLPVNPEGGCSHGYAPTNASGSIKKSQAVINVLNNRLEIERQNAGSAGKWWYFRAFINAVYPGYTTSFPQYKVFVHKDIPSYFDVEADGECDNILYYFNKSKGAGSTLSPKPIYTYSITPVAGTSNFIYVGSTVTNTVSAVVASASPSFIFSASFVPYIPSPATGGDFMKVSDALAAATSNSVTAVFNVNSTSVLDGYELVPGNGYWVYQVNSKDFCGTETSCPSVCYRIVPIPTQPPAGVVPTDFGPISCEAQTLHDIANSVNGQLSTIITNYGNKVRNIYKQQCLQNLVDNFTASYSLTYHHYTLYYYDRAGNLVKTVPPAGVTTTSTTRMMHPAHTFVTEYEYNSLGQLVRQKTPDGGETKFAYDSKGKLRFSRNAKQKIYSGASYIKYDELARIIEVGEMLSPDPAQIDNLAYPAAGVGTSITRTIYTTPAAGITYFGNLPQRYLQNRVSYVYTDVDGDVNTKGDQVSTYYSYDPHGNVEWTIQDIPEIGRNYIAYEYNLVSGRVIKIKYNEELPDKYFHRYIYDIDNRLKSTETSTDGIYWEKDAAYTYYLHGPLKRAEIGHDKIQGEDYVYTILGWLKAKNNYNQANDPGGDGAFSGANMYVARDAYAMILGYHENDFNSKTSPLNSAGTAANSSYLPNTSLYNGNISTWIQNYDHAAMPSAMQTNFAINTQSTGRQFQYDELNRLLVADMKKYDAGTNTWNQSGATNAYKESFEYDANGNIGHVMRYGPGTNNVIDNLYYKNYKRNGSKYDPLTATPATVANPTNRLAYVHEAASMNIYNDIEDQGSPNNYTYDSIGNLISDSAEHIDHIDWNVYGKIAGIYKDDLLGNQLEITFLYDAAGNRVYKKVVDPAFAVTGDKTTYYVRDAKGNAMSVYERTNTGAIPNFTATFTLKEQSIYGSERLGLRTKNISRTVPFTLATGPAAQTGPALVHTSGYNYLMMPLVFNSSKTKVMTKNIDASSTSTAITVGGELHPVTISGGNTLGQGRSQAMAHDEAGNLVLTSYTYTEYNGATPVATTTKIFVKDVTEITVPTDLKNAPDCQAVFMRKPGSSDEYYYFTIGADGKPYYHSIDASSGLILNYNTLMDNTGGYCQTMAAFEDRAGQGNSTLYLKRYNSTNSTSYLNMFSVEAAEVKALPAVVVGPAGANTNIGEICISPTGSYLAVANNLAAGNGEIRLYSLSADHQMATYLNKRTFGTSNLTKSIEFGPSDNYIFATASNGSTTTLFRFATTPASFNTATALGMLAPASTSVGAIRKGANNYLYYITTTASNFKLSMYTNPEAVSSYTTATVSTISNLSNGSLPVQPHLLSYKAPVTSVVVSNRELKNKEYELKDHLGNVHATVADYKVAYVDASPDLVYDERFNDGTVAGYAVHGSSPGGTTVANAGNALQVNSTGVGSAAYNVISLPNSSGGQYLVSFDYKPETCTSAQWVVANAGGIYTYGGVAIEGRNNEVINVPSGTGALDLRFVSNDAVSGHTFAVDNVLVKQVDAAAPALATVVNDDFNCASTCTWPWTANNVVLDYSDNTTMNIQKGSGGSYYASQNLNLMSNQLYKVTIVVSSTANLNAGSQPNAPALNKLLFAFDNDEATLLWDYNTIVSSGATGTFVYYVIPKTNACQALLAVDNAGGGNFEVKIDNFSVEHVSSALQPMYVAVMNNATDYYAFGMPMVGRNYHSSVGYRYGFDGQEKDDEVYGSGNLNTAEFWEYDTRLGRRWNRDPIVKPWESSYACFRNNPICLIDRKGLDGDNPNLKIDLDEVIVEDEDLSGGPPQSIKVTDLTSQETQPEIKGGNSNTRSDPGMGGGGLTSLTGKIPFLGKDGSLDCFNGRLRYYGEGKAGIGTGTAKTARISGLGYEINLQKKVTIGASVNTEDIANKWDENHGIQDPIEKLAKSTGDAAKIITHDISEEETGLYIGGAIFGAGYSVKTVPTSKGIQEQTIKLTYKEYGLTEITFYPDWGFKNIFIGADLSAMWGWYFFGEAGIKGGIKYGDK